MTVVRLTPLGPGVPLFTPRCSACAAGAEADARKVRLNAPFIYLLIYYIHAVDAGISTSYSLSTSATTFCAAAMNFSTTAFAVSSAAADHSISRALIYGCLIKMTTNTARRNGCSVS